MQASSALQQGQAAKSAAEHNIALGEIAAADATDRAEADKQLLAHQFLGEKGAGRTQFAGSNIRLDSGSALDWENDLSEKFISDKAQIDLGASKEIFGIRSQQELDARQGESAVAASRLKAGASLLSGAASAGNSFIVPKKGRA